MGLDWHAVVETTKEDKINWTIKVVQEESGTTEELAPSEFLQQLSLSIFEFYEKAPKWKKPCVLVGASKMKERPTFKQDRAVFVEEMKKLLPGDKYWEKRTVEEEIEESAESFDCDNCPLLKDLNGADSTNSPFLGLTVGSCDFRGKRISASAGISSDLREDAYENRTPEEMLFYADRLTTEIGGLEELRSEELNSEEPDEEYRTMLGWSQESLREAIHWLTVCAGHGVGMATSY